MKWKQWRVTTVIYLLVVINASVYGLTKAQTETVNTAKPVEIITPQKSHPDKIVQKAQDLCDRYKNEGLTLPTLMGIIEVESEFNPKAVSKDTPTSYGLMQVLKATATPILKSMGHKWSLENIYNPDINMEVGVAHLMEIHKHFVASGVEGVNEFHVSLIAYNRGEQPVRDSLKSGSLAYLGKIKIASRKWE